MTLNRYLQLAGQFFAGISRVVGVESDRSREAWVEGWTFRERTRWIVNNWLLLCRTMDPEVPSPPPLPCPCTRVGRPEVQCGNIYAWVYEGGVLSPSAVTLLRGAREEFNQLRGKRGSGKGTTTVQDWWAGGGSRVDLFMVRSTWVITTRRLSDRPPPYIALWIPPTLSRCLVSRPRSFPVLGYPSALAQSRRFFHFVPPPSIVYIYTARIQSRARKTLAVVGDGRVVGRRG